MSSISNQIFSTLYAPTDSQSTCVLKTIGAATVVYVGYKAITHIVKSNQLAKENERNLGKLAEVVMDQAERINDLEYALVKEKYLRIQASKNDKTNSSTNSQTLKTFSKNNRTTVTRKEVVVKKETSISTNALVRQVYDSYQMRPSDSRAPSTAKDAPQPFPPLTHTIAQGVAKGFGESIGKNAGNAVTSTSSVTSAAWTAATYGYNLFSQQTSK